MNYMNEGEIALGCKVIPFLNNNKPVRFAKFREKRTNICSNFAVCRDAGYMSVVELADHEVSRVRREVTICPIPHKMSVTKLREEMLGEPSAKISASRSISHVYVPCHGGKLIS